MLSITHSIRHFVVEAKYIFLSDMTFSLLNCDSPEPLVYRGIQRPNYKCIFTCAHKCELTMRKMIMCYNSMQHISIHHLLLAVSQAFPVPRGPSVRGLKCFIKLIKSQQQSHTYKHPRTWQKCVSNTKMSSLFPSSLSHNLRGAALHLVLV